MRRDFTYIDEIVAGVLAALDARRRARGARRRTASTTSATTAPVELERFIGAIERPRAARPSAS
jgi:nucleoside-diphosphate-sugar epimerase